jgi:hypothetical protein
VDAEGKITHSCRSTKDSEDKKNDKYNQGVEEARKEIDEKKKKRKRIVRRKLRKRVRRDAAESASVLPFLHRQGPGKWLKWRK